MHLKSDIVLKLLASPQILLWNVSACTMWSIQRPVARIEAESGLHPVINQHEKDFTFLRPDDEGLGDAVDQATVTVDQVGHVLCSGEGWRGDGERLDEARWTQRQRWINNESLSVQPSRAERTHRCTANATI